MWEGTWHVTIWTWAETWWPQAAWQGIGRKTTACWALTSPLERAAAALGQVRAHGENLKPGRKLRPKVNSGLTTGACCAPRRFTRMADLFHCMLDPLLRAYIELEGEWVCGSSTLGCQWACQKWTGATWQERAEPHGQFIRIDDFIARH